MDRVLYYRRSHAKNSIISPNKNLAVIREKVQTLCSEVDCFNPSLSTESNLDAVYSYVVAWNPLLLDRSMYSQQQLEKLATYGSFCNSIYHDKKIMIIQVLVFDLYNNSDWTSRFRVCCGIRSGRWTRQASRRFETTSTSPIHSEWMRFSKLDAAFVVGKGW